MDNQKIRAVKIQYIIAALLPLLALALPFLKLSISVTFLGTYDHSMTGIDLLKCVQDINNLAGSDAAEVIKEVIDEVDSAAAMLIGGIVLFFAVPLLLFIISAVAGGMSLRKNDLPRGLAVLPLIALVLSGGGLIISNVMIKSQIKEALEMTGASAEEMSTVSIRLSGQAGFWLFVIVGAVLGIEVLVLGGKNRQKDNDPFVADAIYRSKTVHHGNRQPGNVFHGNRQPGNGNRRGRSSSGSFGEKRRPTTTWTNNDIFENSVYTKGQQNGWNNQAQGGAMSGNPTMKSKGLSGMLIGLRGEYQGAQIRIQSGEKVYIGRSSECNLILTNMKASRKHCRVSYDAEKDQYLITNYSGNGTFLKTGQSLEKEKTYHIPHGTEFRVTKEDEFRVL